MHQSLTTQTLLFEHNLQFLLHEWLEIESLTERPRFSGQSRADYDEVLNLAERLADDKFAPHNRDADISEPRIEDGKVVLVPQVGEALSAFAEAGLLGTSADVSARWDAAAEGIQTAASAWFQAANAGPGYAFLTLRRRTCDLQRLPRPGRPGPYRCSRAVFGTMACRRPRRVVAGRYSTRAEPQPDGSYRYSAPRCGSPAASTN